MHHIYITALISSYEKEIIAGLVKIGYTVSPMADLVYPNGSNGIAGYLIALQVSKQDHIDSPTIYGDIRAILDFIDGKFYSIVITPYASDSVFAGGNFELNQTSTTKVLN